MQTPYSPWGVIIASTMKRNQLMAKTPSLLNDDDEEDLVTEGDIFGALWHYRRLKTKLLMTLEWGLRGGRNRPKHLISSMVSGPKMFSIT